jgi:hypothetical protein
MENIRTCENGHNYDANKHQTCPFCPGNVTGSNFEKSMKEFKKTKLNEEKAGHQFDKTVLNEENLETKTTLTGAGNAKHPFSRTSIVEKGGEKKDVLTDQGVKRKIVGWLITYSHDEYGQDYRIYAGKNKIGSGPSCDIVIPDSSVSAEHVTILHRENEFLFKDAFSTNGTKINGKGLEEGKLKDGDEIKLGNTVIKFKTAQ